MTVEKAFAIKAPPEVIWRALLGELAVGDEQLFEIERSVPNELLSLRVRLQGGVHAFLTYRLVPKPDHTEVVAEMAPEGFRYAVARVITFGRVDTNFELVLVEGLSNLKRVVEAQTSLEARGAVGYNSP